MSARRFTLVVLALLCSSIGGLTLSAPSLALNVHVFSGSFGGEGSGAGQFMEPFAVAVNDATHDVYVADRGNARVEEFTSAGVYIGQFAPPPGGFGTGLKTGPSAIAVDNSGNPLDPSAGDVYVTDSPHHVIDKFSSTGTYEGQLKVGEGSRSFPLGIAVDPSGVLWVDIYREGKEPEIESFSDAQINVFQELIPNFGSSSPGLAVDSEGRLYDYNINSGFLQRTVSGEKIEVRIYGEHPQAGLAVDSSNNQLYLGIGEEVRIFDSRRLLRESFGAGHLTASKGIAVDSSTHVLYVADSATDQIVVFDQIVLPDVTTGEEPTNEQHEGSVTLAGSVNPAGLPVTSCEFEYGTETSYGTVVPCEPSPGSGSGLIEVHADVSGLTPLTRYHYRVVAANANGSSPGIDHTFTAPARPRVSGESVFGVSAGSATFAGQVNPDGANTTYRFEYGLSTVYGESVSGDAGSGVGDVEVSAHPQDLQPGVTYHYRLIAENPIETVMGEDHTFTTERIAGGSELPDGRVWEMVSPPNKQGAAVLPPGGEELVQAAVDGGVISFVASGSTEEEPPGNRAPEDVQVLAQRGSGGWLSRVIATAHDAAHVPGTLSQNSEYELFSPDLSLGLVEAQGTTPLSEETSEPTPYLRHDTECEASPQACYQPLVTAANVAPGTKFGNTQSTSGFDSEVEVEGASPDLSHIVLDSRVALISGGSPGLYEWFGGKLTFVADMELGGARSRVVRHAVSEDGSRVIGTSGPEGGAQELLMRDISKESTIRLDASEPGAAGGENKPAFQTASNDGSRVFFTDSAQLTTDSTAANNMPDLYEFNVETGKLSDLSVDSHLSEHADVLGQVIGASEDGSYVYFVANGVLASGAISGNCGVEGVSPLEATCNLYASHDGVTTFITLLSGEDRHSYAQGLTEMTARVSPNGKWLAFMSDRRVTGYDNRDVRTGGLDEEVFLYNVSTERVVCASCEPTGARPTGAFVVASTETGETQPLIDDNTMWDHIGLAATVPGWTRPSLFKAVYQSRYLSNNGRLLFNSDGALVAQDTNGTWDVYEYEPPGVGSCENGSAAFSETSGGCVGLISSGGSAGESIFMDASENGNDVFFLTSAGLAAQDYDGARDVYDAHACSASSTCFPLAPVAPPPCSTGDSCKAAPSPQPEIFGAPSSETFSGAGNVTIGGVSQNVQSRSLTRAQKLASALRACHKKKKKGGRVACERQARKRYGKLAVKSAVGKGMSGRTGR